jgi:chromosomal replication initiation ATPase DnaA
MSPATTDLSASLLPRMQQATDAIAAAHEALEQLSLCLIADGAPAMPTAALPADLIAILGVVTGYYKLTLPALRGRCRDALHAEARHVYYYLACTLTRRSHDDIAVAIAHERSSCSSALRSLTSRLQNERRLAATVEAVRERAIAALHTGSCPCAALAKTIPVR